MRGTWEGLVIHIDVEKRLPGGELDLCKFVSEDDAPNRAVPGGLPPAQILALACSRFESALMLSQEPTGRVLVYRADGWGTRSPIYTVRVRLDADHRAVAELVEPLAA